MEYQLTLPKVSVQRTKTVKKATIDTVSLFAGCGGMDLGFLGGFEFRGIKYKKNIYQIVLCNDIDRSAARVHGANGKYFSETPFVLNDIKKIDASEIPDFELLLAGFPCQPFSNAGNREGVNDQQGRVPCFTNVKGYSNTVKK